MRQPGPNVVEIEEMLEASRRQYFETLPEHMQRVGEIIRQSLVDGNMDALAQFLMDHKVPVAVERLKQFRDYLILKRLDLKDLEPGARERLRARQLATEDPANVSADYFTAKRYGELPMCRDCRYFVKPPNDGSPDGDKPCISFGTKGSDVACYGFTRPV